MGVFIGGICKGGRLKEVMVGRMVQGRLGWVLLLGMFGNYGVQLELSGELEVMNLLKSDSSEGSMMEVMEELGGGRFMIILLLI